MAVAVASTASTGFATGTSITITKPTGLAAGDLLFAFIYIKGNAPTVTTPSNWTQGTPEVVASDFILTYLYKIADSADAAASNFSFTISSSLPVAGGLLRVTGSAGSSIIAAVDQDTELNGDRTFSGGVTPTQASSLLIMAIGSSSDQQNGDYGSNAVATSNPSWTEAWEFEANLTDGNNYVTQVAYAVRTEVTPTGDYSISGGGYGNANTDYGAFLVCVNPAISVTVDQSTLTPAIMNATGAVPTPTISGGMTATPSVINATGAVLTPAHNDQADWSAQDKSDTATWTNTSKS